MKITWILALVATTAWAAPEGEKGSDVDWSALGNALHSMNIAMPTQTAHLENLDPPPRSLIPQLITAIPHTAMAQLVRPAQRASLASDFKAGTTPAWYSSLPTDVKSYISHVKKQISDGALTAPVRKAAVQTGPAETSATSTGAAATSTAKGMAAGVKPNGVVLGGMGALSVLGVVLAL